MAKDSIPTSRLARTAKVSRLAAGQTARQLGTRAGCYDDYHEGRDPAGITTQDPELFRRLAAAMGFTEPGNPLVQAPKDARAPVLLRCASPRHKTAQTLCCLRQTRA